VPFALQVKDILGPIVSVLAALASALLFYRNLQLSRRTANRSIYLDGQRFVIEICKNLISDPLLWCLYDDHPLQNEHAAEIATPLFQAKLMAFAHLHLNMFDIILVEAPKPSSGKKRNPSNVWFDYFQDTLNRSSIMRKVLEEPERELLWGQLMLGEYERWKHPHPSKSRPVGA
jgi:hypothetical protein